MNAKHSVRAASADALGAVASRGGLTFCQTQEIRKKGKNKQKESSSVNH